MITVTERAKEELKKMWASNIGDPALGFRLTPVEIGQYQLVPDREKERDHVVEYEGAKVLLIDEKLARILEGVTVDYRETASGLGLVVSEQ